MVLRERENQEKEEQYKEPRKDQSAIESNF